MLYTILKIYAIGFAVCVVFIVAIAGFLYGKYKNQDIDLVDAIQISMIWPIIIFLLIPTGLVYWVLSLIGRLFRSKK